MNQEVMTGKLMMSKNYIYEIVNVVDDKRYIGIMKESESWEQDIHDIVNKLDNGTHKIKLLQKDWNKLTTVPYAFEFNILEELDDLRKLYPRQYKIAKKYNAHLPQYGYNYMDTWHTDVDDWEIETNLQRERESGIETEDVHKQLRTVLKNRKFNIKKDRDRNKLIYKLLSNQEFFKDYLSSVRWRDKHYQPKKYYSATLDPFCLGLENISNYLLFAPEKTGKNSDEFYQILSKKKIMYRAKKERRFNYYDIACDDELDEQINSDRPKTKLKKVSLDEKRYYRLKKILNNKDMDVLILDNNKPNKDKYNEKNLMLIKNERDLERLNDFTVANQYAQETIKSLEEWLKNPKLNEHWEKNEFIYTKDPAQALDSEIRRVENTILPEIKKDLSTTKEQLIQRFKFKSPADSTELTLEYDTGYIDESGEYKLVSANKFDFNDIKHVAGLIKVYALIQDYNQRIETDLYHILSTFNELIKNIHLKDYERDIIKWYTVDDMPVQRTNKEKDKNLITIPELLMGKYNIEMDYTQIHRFLHNQLPKMIVDAYKQSKEDYYYTFKIKGEYKTCIECNTPKLAIEKYFSKDKRNKDGLYSVCRECHKNKINKLHKKM